VFVIKHVSVLSNKTKHHFSLASDLFATAHANTLSIGAVRLRNRSVALLAPATYRWLMQGNTRLRYSALSSPLDGEICFPIGNPLPEQKCRSHVGEA
jgi:hypothetical protein